MQNGQIFGISADYTQGDISGTGKENHRLATAGVYYSWRPWKGVFVDVASRYMYLRQELTLDPALGIRGEKRDTHILAGGVRSGYQFSTADETLLISPYIGVSGGTLSGYTVAGHDADISLSSGSPYYGTGGLLVQKRGLWSGNDGIMLTAGIEYQYAPGKSGSKTTLTDRQSTRRYDAWSDNRYRAQLGGEGSLTDSLSVSAKVKSSFGGTFRTDYSGQVGLNYHF